LDVKLEKSDIRRFSDGEINIHVHENVRGADVFIIQPMCPPNVNDNIMELLLLIHTLRLSSAKRVTAIVPYYAYGRQDRLAQAFILKLFIDSYFISKIGKLNLVSPFLPLWWLS
jgi:ribose-phosphate pyrophosphokinase